MRHKPAVPACMPLREGVAPSYVQLSQPGWDTVFAFLCQRFSAISPEIWRERMQRHQVCDQHGEFIEPQTPYQVGCCIFYYRDVGEEPVVAGDAAIIFHNEHLLVADKPHFLPVIPTGKYVRECLLSRLKAETGNAELTPIHRLDRDTAGLVVFSCQRATRGRYQDLFASCAISKIYEAIAPDRETSSFPASYRSRIDRDVQFFRSREVAGEPNSETQIEKLEGNGVWARYRLLAITGKKHQLRLHMAALGMPIRNDIWYPIVNAEVDTTMPLQLLAQSLQFVDPLTQSTLAFTSKQRLFLTEKCG